MNEETRYKIIGLHSRRGMLLAEVLMTFMILAVSLTLIIQAMTMSLKGIVQTEDYAEALLISGELFFDSLSRGSIPYPAQEKTALNDFNGSFLLKAQAPKMEGPKFLSQVNYRLIWKRGSRENEILGTSYLWHQPPP